jgi:hypothetical protein
MDVATDPALRPAPAGRLRALDAMTPKARVSGTGHDTQVQTLAALRGASHVRRPLRRGGVRVE